MHMYAGVCQCAVNSGLGLMQYPMMHKFPCFVLRLNDQLAKVMC